MYIYISIYIYIYIMHMHCSFYRFLPVTTNGNRAAACPAGGVGGARRHAAEAPAREHHYSPGRQHLGGAHPAARCAAVKPHTSCEEFTRLAETRLAQNSLNYPKLV